MRQLVFWLWPVWLLFSVGVLHAAPNLINYQGVLTDNTGAPVTNPAQAMTFRLYDAATAGDLLWEEARTVAVQNGSYNLLLGSVAPLDPLILTGDNVWLEIVVDAEVLSARQRLGSVPYALQAADALSAQAVADGGITNTALADASVTSAKISVPLQLSGASPGSVIHGENSQAGGTAVSGSATAITGVSKGVSGLSRSLSGYGVYGENTAGGYAGYFQGNLRATGTLSGNGSGLTNVNAQTLSGLSYAYLDDLYRRPRTLGGAGAAGQRPPLALPADGFPVFAYFTTDGGGSNSIMVGKCADAECVNGTKSKIYSGGYRSIHSIDMAIGSDGLPVVAFEGATEGGIIHCRDASCSSSDPATLFTTTESRHHINLEIDPAGFPVIEFEVSNGDNAPYDDHYMMVCSDLACQETPTTTLIPFNLFSPEMRIGSDGLPIFFHYAVPGILSIRHCLDISCQASESEINSTFGDYGGFPLTPVVAFTNDGRPAFLGIDTTLSYQECTKPDCSVLTNPVAVQADAFDAIPLSLAYTRDGRPVIAFDSGGVFRILTCSDPNCTSLSGEDIGGIPATPDNVSVVTDPADKQVVLSYGSSLMMTRWSGSNWTTQDSVQK